MNYRTTCRRKWERNKCTDLTLQRWGSLVCLWGMINIKINNKYWYYLFVLVVFVKEHTSSSDCVCEREHCFVFNTYKSDSRDRAQRHHPARQRSLGPSRLGEWQRRSENWNQNEKKYEVLLGIQVPTTGRRSSELWLTGLKEVMYSRSLASARGPEYKSTDTRNERVMRSFGTICCLPTGLVQSSLQWFVLKPFKSTVCLLRQLCMLFWPVR